MKTIWKFKLEAQQTQTIPIPAGSEFLSVQIQNLPDPTISIWVLVDPQAKLYAQRFYLVPTGETVSEFGSIYIGTVQNNEKVAHLFRDSRDN